MISRMARCWGCWLVVGALLVPAGCKKEEPAEPASPIGALAEKAAEVGETTVAAVLVRADKVDGAEDKVVSKCAGCALAMDGSPDHTLNAEGYTLRFCSAECKDRFAADTTKSILEMNFPED
ncbi:MAG: hypothetical protein JSU68_12490 [Phycisphaerales bacterium]|nr:MAG: hypothetical protein JSU68_12490 [Phycisphaerales bacterium]